MDEPDHVVTARAVYDATAGLYAQQVGTEVGAAFEGPIDRAILAAFVEFVRATGGRVADVGCGPGRVAGLLARHDINVVGVDVSPAMLAIARTVHPGIRFEEGRLTALPFEDGSLSGAVLWYSIIHTPPQHLDQVFVEVARVLRAGGYLLVGFQAGEGEPRERADAYGTGITLTNYAHSPADVTASMESAGIGSHAQCVRGRELDHELGPQAFLIGRRTSPSA